LREAIAVCPETVARLDLAIFSAVESAAIF
jgi:hypothetical protein